MKNHLLPLSAFLVIFFLSACTAKSSPSDTPSPSSSSISSIPSFSFSAISVSSYSSFSSYSSVPLPWSASLDVPFMVQAPHAEWNETFEETCEEAALLMVERFLSEGTAFTPEAARDELLDLVQWESAKGYNVDVTIDELAAIARDRFGRKTTVYRDNDVTIHSIKRLLAEGHPVIVPAQGQMLGNPYFSGEGPPYHMLVITGYTPFGSFITNDPGTKRGEGYTYDRETILHAIHDWTGSKETVKDGAKAMLVLKP